MGRHEEFIELCAAATAGELSADEQAKLHAHLDACPECRQSMSEYETVTRTAVAAFAEDHAPEGLEDADSSWSIENAVKAFFKRLDNEPGQGFAEGGHDGADPVNTQQRFTYRTSQIRWQEVWMPFAAAVLLALALGIAAYRTGVQRGTDVARTTPIPAKGTENPLEEQASDAGYERTQLTAKLADNARVIDDLKRQLSEQTKVVNALKATDGAASHSTASGQQTGQTARGAGLRRDEELAAAQVKLQELQKAMDTVTARREEVIIRVATLEAKVGELTRLVREQALDQKESEVAELQELLEYDRDIRELMGARDLYIADVHDVSRTGRDNTYGRVFYTKGKSLIFYAYDLDAQPGLRNASSFQAWGRRGPDKQQPLNLGIFYEDNASKKRWVLKAEDPKTLEDIDAVFVTVEPSGGSHHPSGKQLLFAYLRVSPNHP